MFPLRISGLGRGETNIEVYLVGEGSMRDRNGTLTLDSSHAVDTTTLERLGDLPGVKEGTMVSRFSYKGLLENLEKDAVFAPPAKSAAH